MKRHIRRFLEQYLKLMEQLARSAPEAGETYNALACEVKKTAEKFLSADTRGVWLEVIKMGEQHSGVASANIGREQERQDILLRILTKEEFLAPNTLEEDHQYLNPYRRQKIL